jgi:hypothetical protein
MGKSTFAVFAYVLLSVAAFPQETGNANAVGTWKLDLQKTTAPTKPKSMTLRITVNSPTALKYSFSQVDANGKAVHVSYSGAPDGQPHPLTGSTVYSTAAYTHPNGDTQAANATLTMKDGTTVTQEIKLSDDGKTMTVQSKSGDKSWTDVYDRVGAGKKKAASKKAVPSGP